MATVEKELRAALARLIASAPSNPELAKRARSGRLTINPTTVALEADVSRTNVSHDGCDYPEVRKAILNAKAGARGEPTTMAEVNRNLRLDIAAAVRAKRVAEEMMAAMVVRMNKVESDAKRHVETEIRKIARGNRDPNALAGSRLAEADASPQVALVGGTDTKK